MGILAPPTWETSRSNGTWAAFGATASAHSTNPSPSWRPETASLMANCLAYPSLLLRKRNGVFSPVRRAKTQLMALLTTIKYQASSSVCVGFCWHKETRAAAQHWSSPAALDFPFDCRFYMVSLQTSKSLGTSEEETQIPKLLSIFRQFTQIILFNIPALSSCKIAMMWDTERVQ